MTTHNVVGPPPVGCPPPHPNHHHTHMAQSNCKKTCRAQHAQSCSQPLTCTGSALRWLACGPGPTAGRSCCCDAFCQPATRCGCCQPLLAPRMAGLEPEGAHSDARVLVQWSRLTGSPRQGTSRARHQPQSSQETRKQLTAGVMSWSCHTAPWNGASGVAATGLSEGLLVLCEGVSCGSGATTSSAAGGSQTLAATPTGSKAACVGCFCSSTSPADPSWCIEAGHDAVLSASGPGALCGWGASDAAAVAGSGTVVDTAAGLFLSAAPEGLAHPA